MRTHLLLCAFAFAVSTVVLVEADARACGGCFQGPTQTGDVITAERMIFAASEDQTTLYDEISYSGNPASFAWVLPIKGPVTVGLSSDILFSALDSATKTTIVAPFLPPCASCSCVDAPSAGTAQEADAAALSDGGVTVLSQETVGPYETVQLKSSKPGALSAWLQANGYVIPAATAPVVAAYVSEGFDFLALKLVPGAGVNEMRPVRVTTQGAALSLPLRMVAVGTGATVGVTLWVVGDGRYEPQNFPTFTISGSELVWDWSTELSNYTTVQAQKEAAFDNGAWQIESALQISPYQVEEPVLASPASQDYLAIPGADGGTGDGGSDGETADQVRAEDLATLFPGGEAQTVWVTRMLANLSHAALANDLVVQASSDQTELSNRYLVTQSINAPKCPVVPDPCPPCDYGSSSGGSSGGGGGASDSPRVVGGGCSAAPEEPGSAKLEIGLAGLALVAFIGKRRRPRE